MRRYSCTYPRGVGRDERAGPAGDGVAPPRGVVREAEVIAGRVPDFSLHVLFRRSRVITSAMKPCGSCEQQNPDDALFCLRCGKAFPAEEDTGAADSLHVEEEQYWRVLIGPSKCLHFTLSGGWAWKPAWDYYRRVFQRFDSREGPRFSLTWNWAPFLLEPFLWFLYRKMYLFALVYFFGPLVSVFLTNDVSVSIVWSVIAGASANYLYYWHLKDIVLKAKKRAALDPAARLRELAEEGGIQPYVLWLVVALILLKIGVLYALLDDLPLQDEAVPLPDAEEQGDRRAF